MQEPAAGFRCGSGLTPTSMSRKEKEEELRRANDDLRIRVFRRPIFRNRAYVTVYQRCDRQRYHNVLDEDGRKFSDSD